jgi:transcriptional regulator with XRE-family HTH domain
VANIGAVSEEAVRALLGRTLRVLRQKAELTQEMLAERAGTTQNQVSDWETGKSWLVLKSITSVLVGLGASLAGFAAAMAEQARKLAPDTDWERWLEGAGPGDQTDEVAEGPDPGSHVYIVIAAPADRVRTFTGGAPHDVLGAALGGGRVPKPPA